MAVAGAVIEKCVARPAPVLLTAPKAALIDIALPLAVTVSGLVCETALPFTVEDWKAYSVLPNCCGSAKLIVQTPPAFQVKFAGVV